MNLTTLIEQKISEAVYDSASGDPRPLDYSVGFQNKKSLKTGEMNKETFLNINGLTPTDRVTLGDRYNPVVPPSKKFNGTAKKDGSGVFYSMTNDEAFTNSIYFKKMYEYLKGTGNYIMPDPDIMKAEISQAKMDSVSPEMITAQNGKFEDMFEKIMRSLNDPRTQELLQKISSIGFDINEKVYGNVISPGNAMKAFSVKPDASFLATRKNFRKLYNRILTPNAKQILLSIPNTTGRSASKAEAELGVKFDDIRNNPHKVDAFKVHSTTGLAGFSFGVFFDISDTILIPGYPDTFTGQAGLADNLKGVLNSLAGDELGTSKIQSDELGISADTEKNATFFNRFIKYLSANPNTISNEVLGQLSKMDPSKDETVVSILRAYFSDYAFAREHDPNVKTAKVYAAMAATLTVEQLAEVERLKIIKMHEKNVDTYLKTRKDFVSISLPVTNVCRILKPINESTMNEDINVTAEDIMSLFNINPAKFQGEGEVREETEENHEEEIEQIKESFFNTLNKLYKTK